MENLTGGTPPVRYLPCVVPCKLYFETREAAEHFKDTFVPIMTNLKGHEPEFPKMEFAVNEI